MLTDMDYLALLRNGDKKGFEYFNSVYYQHLSYYAFTIIKVREEANDITQEALIKLWERRHTFQNSSSVKSFLYITVKNLCLNYLKREKFREHSIRQHPAPEAEYNPLVNDNNEQRAEIMEMLKTRITKLTARKQEIFNLMMKDLSNQEIAAQLGIKVQTVRSQKHMIKQFLMEQVRLYLSGEE